MALPDKISFTRGQLWAIGRGLVAVVAFVVTAWIGWVEVRDGMQANAQAIEELDDETEAQLRAVINRQEITEKEVNQLRLLLLQQEGAAARDREEIKGDIKAILSMLQSMGRN